MLATLKASATSSSASVAAASRRGAAAPRPAVAAAAAAPARRRPRVAAAAASPSSSSSSSSSSPSAPAPPPNPLAPPVAFAALAADASAALNASHARPLSTLARAVLSGCYIALGGLVAAVAASGAPGLARLVFALVFPVGLLLNLSHGGELFTGQTMRASVAVLAGKATPAQLALNWAVSFCGNLVGSLAVLALVLASGLFFAPPAGPAAAAFAGSLAQAKMALPFGEAVCRGVLANWLVCMAVWQASTARTPSDRFFAVWPPIAAFVAAGLEHSVANMFLVPLGLAVGSGLDAASFGRFLATNLLPVTLGNALAGAAVVGAVSHGLYGAPKESGAARAA